MNLFTQNFFIDLFVMRALVSSVLLELTLNNLVKSISWTKKKEKEENETQ